MNYQEALDIIRRHKDASITMVDIHEAALLISYTTRPPRYEDILECVKIGGMAAEIAALQLYQLTNRHRDMECETSFDNWQSYLREHKFI